jgi:hypothetical protein
MPKFVATTPIKHDGKRYSVGSPLTLKAEDAAGLLASGAIKADAADDKTEAKRNATAQAEAARLAAEQVEAERLAAEQAEAERLAAGGETTSQG